MLNLKPLIDNFYGKPTCKCHIYSSEGHYQMKALTVDLQKMPILCWLLSFNGIYNHRRQVLIILYPWNLFWNTKYKQNNQFEKKLVYVG